MKIFDRKAFCKTGYNKTTITKTAIKNNDYSLNISLYVEKLIEDNLPNQKEALTNFKIAFKDLEKIEKQFEDQIRENK